MRVPSPFVSFSISDLRFSRLNPHIADESQSVRASLCRALLRSVFHSLFNRPDDLIAPLLHPPGLTSISISSGRGRENKASSTKAEERDPWTHLGVRRSLESYVLNQRVRPIIWRFGPCRRPRRPLKVVPHSGTKAKRAEGIGC